MKFMNNSLGFKNLQIIGKNLIDVEEENIKLLKGKKRLIINKYGTDEIKNIEIFKSYTLSRTKDKNEPHKNE